MPNERVTRSFPARREVVPAVLEFATSESAALGLPPKRLMHLELAVEEAVVNTCSYGYPEGDGEVEVTVWAEGGRVVVEIADSGFPFDPLAKAAPDLRQPMEDRPVGGLGIHLIRKVSDEVLYRRVGDRNLLTMFFEKEAS